MLFCPCCNSVFSHLGKVLRGPAKVDLPWAKMFFKNDNFYVDMGTTVDGNYRFTTDEIEKVIKDYNFKFRKTDEIDPHVSKIPEILRPKADQTISLDELEEADNFDNSRTTPNGK